MSRSRTLALALYGALLVGCGGHTLDGGPAASVDAGVTAVQGSINGVSIPAAYALAIPDNSNATAGPTNEYTKLALGIANKPVACTTATLPESTFIGIELISVGSVPVGPGTYEINADPTSHLDNVAALVTTDAACKEASPASCVGGTVTITSASDTVVTGSFTLAFDSGEAMSGTFAAAVCGSIPPSLNGVTC